MFGFGEPADSAIAILTADHRKVDEMFKQFEAETAKARKHALALRICDELTVHAKAEEEREKMPKEKALIWEATVEHGTLEGIIEIIRELNADDEQFDAHVKVLGEYVKHHVREEEDQIFPTVRKTALDMQAMGREINERKTELRAQIGHSNGNGRKPSVRASTGSSTQQ